MLTLYEKLSEIDNKLDYKEIKNQLVTALLTIFVPPREYFADERIFQQNRDLLSSIVCEYLRSRGADISYGFTKKVYFSFTPKRGYRYTTEPLLNILYGRIGGDKVPDEVFEQLPDWYGLYFLPGIWHGMTSKFEGERYNEVHLNAWSVKTIVARTIRLGVKKLRKYEEKLGKKLPKKEEILKECDLVLNPQAKLF